MAIQDDANNDHPSKKPLVEDATPSANALSRSLLQSKLSHLHHIKPHQNHLLAALPPADLERLQNDLKLVHLTLGDSLYTPGAHISYAYFPVTCLVSLHYVTETGASAETAEAGNEGVVGVSLIMDGGSMASSATVLVSGYAYRMDASSFRNAFKQLPSLQAVLLKYLQMLYTQTAQTAVCYRYHTIEQQLARWLLSTTLRITTNELVVTQEQISGLLGVRRESITQAASSLQQANLINYRRGHISVLNREKLEGYACECYMVVQTELVRLLPSLKK